MKSFSTTRISVDVANKIAAQLKIRRQQEAASVEVSKICLDVRMRAMKPLVTSGMIDGIKFFQSPEGKALILKGVEKAGLSRCYDPNFIALVNEWSSLPTTVLDPVFEPIDAMPPGTEGDDYLAYVNIDDEELDDELMDLVGSDEDQADSL
jgi:hypothetical protein